MKFLRNWFDSRDFMEVLSIWERGKGKGREEKGGELKKIRIYVVVGTGLDDAPLTNEMSSTRTRTNNRWRPQCFRVWWEGLQQGLSKPCPGLAEGGGICFLVIPDKI
jgi:hypothetical protein